MMKRLNITILLLMMLQIAFCQEISQGSYPAQVIIKTNHLPKIIWIGDTLSGLTNPQMQSINTTYDMLDKCHEEKSVYKEYSQLGDSTSIYQKQIISKLNNADSIYRQGIIEYQNLVDIQNSKYRDMNDSWTSYTKSLKKQNRKQFFSTIFTTIPITIAIGVLLLTIRK